MCAGERRILRKLIPLSTLSWEQTLYRNSITGFQRHFIGKQFWFNQRMDRSFAPCSLSRRPGSGFRTDVCINFSASAWSIAFVNCQLKQRENTSPISLFDNVLGTRKINLSSPYNLIFPNEKASLNSLHIDGFDPDRGIFARVQRCGFLYYGRHEARSTF